MGVTGRWGWPLAGRDGELSAVAAAVAAGTPVVLAGDAGVGKTRLLREALDLWGDSGGETRWVVATSAAASIPFGAVSHLLPGRFPRSGSPAEFLSRVAQSVAAVAGGGPVVVGVDDAHLLEDASAGLLHQLTVRGLIVPVATVRVGEQVNDAVTAIWKDGGLRLRVEPLPERAVDELLDHAVGGQIDPISRRRLRRLAHGNPLLLRELLADAVDTGALGCRDGIWHWRTIGPSSARLAELVAVRLAALDPSARQALEAIACGEPLPLGLLHRVVDPAAVEAAEGTGMAVAERAGARTMLRMAHPLYGETLRAHLPAARAQRIFAELARALMSGPMRHSDDTLKAGVWQLQSGDITHPQVVVAAGRQAIDRFDLDLAERLARAACDTRGDWDADFLLAQVLHYRDRNPEALRVLPDAPPPRDKRQARWAITHARILYWGLGRADDAEQTLLDVPADAPGSDLTEATRSWILHYDGRCQDALAAAQAVLDRPTASDRAVIWAAMGGASAAGTLGRLDDAIRIATRGQKLADAHPDRYPWADAQLGFGLCYALRAAGHLDQARQLADDGHQAAIARDAAAMAGVWAAFRGLNAKSQGRLTDADTALREAVVLVADDDQYQMVRVCLAELAGTAALAGHTTAAIQWLARADAHHRPANRLYDAWIELNRAWVHAATGRLDTAAETAQHAAKLAHDTDQPTFEAVALYDAARLDGGADLTDSLHTLADHLNTEFSRILADAATALTSRDGHALDRATTAFTRHGQTLLAAETAAAAARAHRKSGHHSLARAAAEHAADLVHDCPGVRTPLLLKADGPTALLTHRERQIALLAIQHTSRHIAGQLGLSITTVNNTLARAYTKLGITRRTQIASVLYPTAAEPLPAPKA